MKVKVWYRIEVTGFIDVDAEDIYAAEEIVKTDTPVADLIAEADLSEAVICDAEAQV